MHAREFCTATKEAFCSGAAGTCAARAVFELRFRIESRVFCTELLYAPSRAAEIVEKAISSFTMLGTAPKRLRNLDVPRRSGRYPLPLQNMRFKWAVAGNPQKSGFQDAAPRIDSLVAQQLLDAQELVVFGEPIGTRERAGLDLPAIRRHREIGDGGIFRPTVPVRHHRAIGIAVRGVDRV